MINNIFSIDFENQQFLQKVSHWGGICTVALLLTLVLFTFYNEVFRSRSLTNPSTPTASSLTKQQPASTLDVSDFHIFDQEIESSTRESQLALLSAPETNLNLTLRGTLTDSDDQRASAIVANSADQQEVYHIGDRLPGGARLQAIEQGRIVISRSGQLESLSLPKKSTMMAAMTQRPRSGASNPTGIPSLKNPGNLPSINMASVRNQIMADPLKFAKNVTPMAVTDRKTGKMKGIRLSAGRNSDILKKLGIRRTDIITQVNGLPLNDPGKTSAVLGQLQNAQQLSVTIERDGQPVSLTIDLRQ